jgi:hypothetical protein
MTATLFLVTQVGPFEGSLRTAFSNTGQTAYFYHLNENRFYPKDSIASPIWLGGEFLAPTHFLRTKFIDDLLQAHQIDRVVAVGLDASHLALQWRLKFDVHVILNSGDLDFSVRRKGHVFRLKLVLERARHLLLSDTWEMDKAVGHGSRVPHYLLPDFVLRGDKVLTTDAAVKRIALITPPEMPLSDAQELAQELQAMADGYGYTVQKFSTTDLYSTVDLELDRGLQGTFRYRIGHCSHAVVAGDSRDMGTIISALASQPGSLVVGASITNTHAARRAGIEVVGQGIAAVVDRARLMISAAPAESTAQLPVAEPADHAAALDALAKRRDPWFFEELVPSEHDDFQVFFTVAPLENRSNGARPQRIRNMAAAMEALGPTVRITPNPQMLERRTVLVSWLLEHGFSPSFFYGENSTSPMETYDAIARVRGLIEQLGARGAATGWFVRDLHWLSEERQFMTTDDPATKSFVARGLYELNAMSEAVDTLFSPDDQSTKEFVRLLDKRSEGVHTWAALPPGTNPHNFITGDAAPTERITLVYSGGVGGFYGMDTFLDAVSLAGLENFNLDFVIREEDRGSLEALLNEHSMSSEGGRIRTLTVDFEDYIPRPGITLGVVLLDGEYASAAFPYKTMSLLERDYPILTFDNMAIVPFVEANEAGYALPRDAKRLAQFFLSFHETHSRRPPSSGRAREANTWLARVQHARSVAVSARSRPSNRPKPVKSAKAPRLRRF